MQKKCGFIIRVSTERQAQNKEGSLVNQLQRLRAHVEYKSNVCGEDWKEIERYELKAVSGKDSFRTAEFGRLIEDIKAGRVNTVLCTALDRVSRSVRDFLSFFELLAKYNVEFVCLKQNYDTTTSQGKLFITIMMALAEFEREQTSERTREACIARADRGLWTGSQLLGYNIDPARKGYLIPNEQEKALVNFAFDTYLKCASLIQTAKTLNDHGYRTKQYVSRRNISYPGKRFCYSSTQQMLTNMAYIGLKEVNKRKRTTEQSKLPENERYRTVKAVWPAIVEEAKFHATQELLKKNYNSKHNGHKPLKHSYILNSGLLWCDKCGGEMEGTSAIGRKGVRYYYYVCKNRACRQKVPAGEIESVVLERMKALSGSGDMISRMIRAANETTCKEMPQLRTQKEALEKELAKVNNTADKLMNRWAAVASDSNTAILKEKLDQLAERRKEIENGVGELAAALEDLERFSLSDKQVGNVLKNFSDMFEKMKPYQQKEAMHILLHKAVLGEKGIKIALHGKIPDAGLVLSDASELRTQMPNWLPGLDSNQQPFGYKGPRIASRLGLYHVRSLRITDSGASPPLARRVLPLGIVSAPSRDRRPGLGSG